MIRGTRLSVAFLFGLLAEGWTTQEILENYPQLSGEALQWISAGRQHEALSMSRKTVCRIPPFR